MAALRAAPVFALLTLVTLAGCSSSNPPEDATGGGNASSSGGGSSAGLPDLDVGDHWTQKVAGGGVEVTSTTEVKAREDHGGVPAWRVEGTATSAALGTTTTTDTITWIRRSDLATMETRATTQATYPGQPQQSPPQSSTTVFDPPCKSIDWPLSVGKTWSETCQQTTVSNGNTQSDSTTTNYTVEGRESVTVPAGTFDAFRVKATTKDTTVTQFIAVKACGVVKTTSATYGAQSSAVSVELQSYKC